MYVSDSHTAVNSLFHILHSGILISFVGNVYPSHVHHKNLYQFLSDSTGNVNVGVSTVYSIAASSTPVKLTVYVIGVQLAVITLSHVSLAVMLLGVHPLNVYPLFANAVNVNSSP